MQSVILCFLILVAVFVSPTVAEARATTTQRTPTPPPTFTIEGDTFKKDGSAFRYISGSFHYFRSRPEYWEDILQKMKAAGLNAVQTYVEWSSHQPNPMEEYNFNGSLNLFHFLELAHKNDLLVILRPGPFIDAERDMGGLPAWLLWQKSDIKLRTNDLEYNYFVSRWFDHLLPRLVPYLYENGGPIITVQVENEYGSYGCDKNYTIFLRDLLRMRLGSNVILFTTDGNAESYLECGTVPDVYPTVDFGPGTDVQSAINIQRKFAPTGPLVNSEYYTGWLDHWQKPHSTRTTDEVVNTLRDMLGNGMNVNLYMFYGGTSFGYSAGTNIDDGMFDACPTSYDYDAPLNEARDPTEKYFQIREFIAQYSPAVPQIPPSPSPKGDYGPVQLKPFSFLLHPEMLQVLESSPVKSRYPLSFEELKIASGFVLYEIVVQFLTSDPVLLSAESLKDRGYIYVDQVLVGILSRTEKITSVPIYIPKGSKLSILVENQGRPCFGSEIGESKGLGNVTVGSERLMNWKMFRVGELNADVLTSYAQKLFRQSSNERNYTSNVRFPRGALGSNTFYYGNLTLESPKTKNGFLLDTFIRFDGWNKGLIWVNGFNLGRYWPVVGPQKTLYLPGALLKPPPQTNTFIIFEQESAPDECVPTMNLEFFNDCNIYLTDTHVINGETPYSRSLVPLPLTRTFNEGKSNEENNNIEFNIY